ncbi:MAG: hypothetical protein LBP23_09130 [Treponema sp.]|jgi:hypothetical protein|nr:hypothetical protein [Treponema sp.]
MLFSQGEKSPRTHPTPPEAFAGSFDGFDHKEAPGKGVTPGQNHEKEGEFTFPTVYLQQKKYKKVTKFPGSFAAGADTQEPVSAEELQGGEVHYSAFHPAIKAS